MTLPVQPVPSAILAAREGQPTPRRRGAAQQEAPPTTLPPVGYEPAHGGVFRCTPCTAGLEEGNIASPAQRVASAYRSVMPIGS